MHIDPRLILFILLASCSGQDKTSAPQQEQDQPGESRQSPAESVPMPNAHFAPLYYEGQLCHWVREIAQDKNGHLWFGTNHYGAIRYNGDKLEYFTVDRGFGGARVTGIAEDRDGNLWFGNSGGITKYDPTASLGGGASFTNYSQKEWLRADQEEFAAEVWSIAVARNGLIWIGTADGVRRFDGKTFSTFDLPHPDIQNKTFHISPERVSRILGDKDGTIWFGRDGYGIARYDPSASLKTGGQSFTHFTKKDGLADNNISSLLEDKVGNIWIGTMYGGVSVYDGQSFTNVTRNGMIAGDEVSGLYEDKAGNIWFAAEHHGVYRYDPSASRTPTRESFTNFHGNEGLATNGILSILEDREGRFWFGGWKGLFRLDPSASLGPGEKSFLRVTRTGPWGATIGTE